MEKRKQEVQDLSVGQAKLQEKKDALVAQKAELGAKHDQIEAIADKELQAIQDADSRIEVLRKVAREKKRGKKDVETKLKHAKQECQEHEKQLDELTNNVDGDTNREKLSELKVHGTIPQPGLNF